MTTTARLWELVDLRRQIDTALEDSEGELTPEIAAALDAFDAAFPEKVQAVTCYIKDLLADAKKMKDAEDGFAARKMAFTNRAKSLTAYLDRQMSDAGVAVGAEIGGPQGSAKFALNPPSVQELVPTGDEDFRNLYMIAPVFVRRVPESYAWNKEEIKAAAKNDALPDEVKRRVTVTRSKSLRLK